MTANKIGVIGDKDSVLGFMAVGFAVYTAETAEEAGVWLHRLAGEGYAVIFITERYAEQLADEIGRYREQTLPAVISIPGKEGATGYGMANIRKSVENAVGADILFKE